MNIFPETNSEIGICPPKVYQIHSSSNLSLAKKEKKHLIYLYETTNQRKHN